MFCVCLRVASDFILADTSSAIRPYGWMFLKLDQLVRSLGDAGCYDPAVRHLGAVKVRSSRLASVITRDSMLCSG